MKSVMTVRLDPEIKRKLDKMARAMARTKSFLVTDAVKEYLLVNEWQIEAIREGFRQADEGRLVSHENVVKKWKAKLARSMD